MLLMIEVQTVCGVFVVVRSTNVMITMYNVHSATRHVAALILMSSLASSPRRRESLN